MTFMFPEISDWRRKKMLPHAHAMLQAQEMIFAQTGHSILQYVLENKTKPQQFQHYPPGDRIDHQTGAQYFYHCHRENLDTEEHGHFHCFMRYPQIPKHIKPAQLPDWDRYIDNPMTHLIAIAMNRYGQPTRLFTVNRWVSSEIWYEAKHGSNLLNRFKMTLEDSYWQLLDTWIESLLHLFAPQITWLMQQRDDHIQLLQQKNPNDNAYDNEHVEELSSLAISIEQQVAWLIQRKVNHPELSS
jgi:hypothetical protein